MADLDVLETVSVADWHEAVSAAQDTGHRFFDWLTAVDRTHDEAAPGFDVVVRLLALPLRPTTPTVEATLLSDARGIQALRITTRVKDGESLASVTDLFAGAAWHERETFEMFGIDFTGFDDGTGQPIRPLLLPDGFEGTPLRKSFVLAARATKPWPGGKEPGEGHGEAKSPGRRRVQAPGVPGPEWGPR